jgi:hypothetical protein
MSANRFGVDIGKLLQEGVRDNNTLLYFDLRMAECGQEAEYAVNQKLKANREEDRLRRIQERNHNHTNERTYSHLF